MFNYQPFDKSIINDAKVHARSEFPKESCGVIVDDEYIRFENSHSNPENDFLISSREFNQLYIEERIQCIIHSHNDYKHASLNDQIQQRALEVPFGIINLKNGVVFNTFFFGESLPIAPLYERPFHFGVYDCLSFVKDHYKQELNIELPNPPREYGFWEKNIKMFEDHIKTIPLYEVEIKDLKRNDLLFYKCFGRVIDHVGIYLEKGVVGHHFADQVSTRLPINTKRKYLSVCLRYKI